MMTMPSMMIPKIMPMTAGTKYVSTTEDDGFVLVGVGIA
jgi:hypothetical protein